MSLLKTNNQFNTVKAMLNTVVASQEERIKEVANEANLVLVE